MTTLQVDKVLSIVPMLATQHAPPQKEGRVVVSLKRNPGKGSLRKQTFVQVNNEQQ